MPLSEKDCVPCRGGVPPLDASAIAGLSPEIPSWSVVAGHHLQREFAFPDFATALAFVNRVGELAEAEAHHPDIDIRYNKVRLALVTHDAFNAVTEKDLEMAGKINALLPELEVKA